MAETLAELVAKITADATELKKALASAEKDIQGTGRVIEGETKSWQDRFKAVGESCAELGRSLGKIAVGVGAIGAAITTMAVSSIKAFADMGQELSILKIQTGLSVKTLSELKYMADLAEVDLSSLVIAIKTMSSMLYDASKGLRTAKKEAEKLGKAFDYEEWAKTEPVVAAFEALGLSIENLVALSPEERFWAVANAIGRIEDANTRAALATDVFGRGALALLPILAQTTEEMQTARDMAAKLGVTMDEETLAKAEALDLALKNLQESFRGVGLQIGETLMPYIVALADKLIPIIENIMKWIEKNPEWVTAIAAVGAAFVAFGMILGTIAAILLMINILMGNWIAVAIAGVVALAAGLGTYFGLKELQKKTEKMSATPGAIPTSKVTPLSETIPGKWEKMAKGGIIVGEAGPEAIIPLGEGMGSTYSINIGNFMGDESSLRAFARKLKDIIGEDGRRTSFSGINRLEYFPGSSAP